MAYNSDIESTAVLGLGAFSELEMSERTNSLERGIISEFSILICR